MKSLYIFPHRKRGLARRALIWLTLLLAVITASGVGAYLWREYQTFSNAALLSQDATIELKPGSGLDALLTELNRAGAAPAPRWQWQMLLKQLKLERKLKAGEFAISKRDTPRTLLFAIAEGKVVQHRLTIIEGTRFKDLRILLAKHPALTQSIQSMDDAQVLVAIGATETHPEGLFLPETYRFPKGFSDLELLKKAYWDLQRELKLAWEKRAPDVPLSSPYEALILASIVEKETGQPQERPEIAGVFARRLKSNMRLQTDPTVIYGMGENYQGNIRKSDLTTDTPYNTYTRAGLPPTPIALAGKAAIRAALNPAPGETLYFVAMGNGTHIFSKTYEEHDRAVDEYQRKRARNR
jgi:UPF0755 protein